MKTIPEMEREVRGALITKMKKWNAGWCGKPECYCAAEGYCVAGYRADLAAAYERAVKRHGGE